MPSFKKFLLGFTTFLIAFTLFDFVAGNPGKIDEALPFNLWIAILVQFFLWLASILSWGRILAASIGIKHSPTGINLALGSLFYAFVALLLASIGLLNPSMRYFLFILQSLALAWSPGHLPRLNKPALIGAIPLGLLFTLNTLDSLVIHPYWDPLHHHLVGVRQFWEFGQMYFPENSIASYQEGGFEFLFLWPHFFFAKAGGLGLLPVQIFSQLTHSVLGFGGSVLIAYAIARRWLPSVVWQLLSITLFAIPASLQFAVPTAKNDWGIIMWVLAGFWILCSVPLSGQSRMPRRFVGQLTVAGLIWGFAFLAKLSSCFAIGGFSLVVIYRRLSFRELTAIAAGFLLGALPLAVRNWGATGDPLFPLLPALLHSDGGSMGPSWQDALRIYREHPIGFARIKEFFVEYPLSALIVLIPLLALRRKEDPTIRAAGAAFTIGLALFSITAGKATELRLLGPLLPFSALLVCLLLSRIGDRLPLSTKKLPWMLLALLAILLPYRWSTIPRLSSIPYSHLLTRAYISGEAQGWFRDNFRPGMRAALLVESRTYHSLPLPVIRPWDAPRIDARLRSTKTGREFIRTLHELGFTHLILSSEKLDLFYPKELVGIVESYVLPLTDTHNFKSQHSIVADVRLLLLKER